MLETHYFDSSGSIYVHSGEIMLFFFFKTFILLFSLALSLSFICEYTHKTLKLFGNQADFLVTHSTELKDQIIYHKKVNVHLNEMKPKDFNVFLVILSVVLAFCCNCTYGKYLRLQRSMEKLHVQ